MEQKSGDKIRIEYVIPWKLNQILLVRSRRMREKRLQAIFTNFSEALHLYLLMGLLMGV